LRAWLTSRAVHFEVCRRRRASNECSQPLRLMPCSCASPALLCPLSVALELFDVMHQAVHLPLCIHFAPAPECEAIQSLGVAEVAKHGLDDPEAPTVFIPTDWARISAGVRPSGRSWSRATMHRRMAMQSPWGAAVTPAPQRGPNPILTSPAAKSSCTVGTDICAK